ncbi:hypothetical protein [Candidatus Thiosymbion oneisti]|uniref:hypothetical protein n=1 Tax=Candidatus Thiosymbion oneisti TaxID=589554 RepID=UPI00114C959B|nr:hypothetical protein [Candidatus Thiosymbion oneisti]
MMAIYNPLPFGIKSKLLPAIAGFLFSISACHASDNVNPDFLTVVKIEKFKLELHRRQDRCAIRLNDVPKSELLGIPYPCGFVRVDERLTAQTYHYKGVGQVFVVAGPLADKKAYTESFGVKPEYRCSNQGQAIIVQENKLILRQAKYIPLGFCHHLGFDEKDYYGFAHPID